MTRALFLSLLAGCIALPLQAGDKPTVNYVAEVTGMVCAGCKDHVTASFKKLDGVSNVAIAAAGKPGTQKVTVTSTSDALTKEQAVAALGSSASTYIVHTWDKQK